MKKLIILTTVYLFSVNIIFAQDNKPFNTILKGIVVNRPESSALLLIKKGEDYRVKRIEIPIINNSFEYELKDIQYTEAYDISFKDEVQNGAWMPITFFVEPGIIYMELHPREDFAKNKIEGNSYNNDYVEFRRLRESLFDLNKIQTKMKELPQNGLSEIGVYLLKEIERTEDMEEKRNLQSRFYELAETKEIYTEEYKDLETQGKELWYKYQSWEDSYIADTNTLIGYMLLISKIEDSTRKKDDESMLKYINLYNNKYSKKYPDHPYTEQAKNKINAYTKIKTGNKYIDFTLPDFEGNMVTLSNQIKGKIALLDMWASWCGPCRNLSISMIPVYEEFKDRGFTIVGIAREDKLIDAINAVKKDNYPWLNLIELNDANKIWEKYGIGNSGGKTFLIDEKGIIIAVEPKAEDVRRILTERLRSNNKQ